MYEWIHDDITWCVSECSYTECERNQVNMLNKTGLHSYAMFKNTETCPLYRKEILNKEHGKIVKTWCMYSDSHNGEQPRCMSSCNEEGCEYALIMYEDGYSRYGNENEVKI